MKILVLGVTGMLGHKVFATLSKEFSNVYGASRYAKGSLLKYKNIIPLDNIKKFTHYDSSNMAYIVEGRYDIIVNCVGLIPHNAKNKTHADYIELNALLPHKLANLGKPFVIHFSTDCVFSGKEGFPYTESSVTNAKDIYGMSKALGELTHYSNALTIRTSFIGRELKNHTSLLEWFLHNTDTSVKGYVDAIYSGVTTQVAADVVIDIIKNHSNLRGLIHLASEPISKFDLLTMLGKAFSKKIKIKKAKHSIDKTLLNGRILSETNIKIPTWDVMIENLAKEKDYEFQ